MEKVNKPMVIMGYTVVCIMVLFIVEQWLQTPYAIKTAIKIPMFTAIPWLLNKYMVGTHIGFEFPKESRHILAVSIVCMVIAMLITYVIVYSFLDIDLIVEDFNQRMKISKNMMLLAGIYTCFGNSLIEEYFFRGFILLGFEGQEKRLAAYVISALAFAVYHVTIFIAWFELPLLFLALLGLFIGGLIFAFFAEKTKSLVGSWLIHMVADVVIVGLGLFGWGIYYA